MAGGTGVRAAVPDAHSAKRLHANSLFWLSVQPNPATKTSGDPCGPTLEKRVPEG